MATPAHLLIVEDDDALQSLYGEFLREEGYCVTLLDRLPDVASLQTSAPDLLILDFLVDGACLLALIRTIRTESATADLPMIVCTGAVAQARAAAAELASLDVGLVLKPFDLDDLLAEVRRRLPGEQKVPGRNAMAAPSYQAIS